MKRLIEYICEQYEVLPIFEKFESSAIQQFMKIIQDDFSTNKNIFTTYRISCHGMVNEKPLNTWYSLRNNNYKENIKWVSQEFKLGKIKDEWIHKFDDGKQVLDKNEIEKLLGDISKKNLYGGLNAWAVKNHTYIFLLSKGDSFDKIDEPVAAIFLEPNKASEIINVWYNNRKNIDQNTQPDKLSSKQVNMYKNKYKLCLKALEEYKNNSSDKENKLITDMVKYYTQNHWRISDVKNRGKQLDTDTLQEVRAEILNWLFFNNYRTDHFLYRNSSKEQHNILQEFWKDLENRFTIKDFKLTSKK